MKTLVVLLTKSSSLISISSNPLPCFPFLNLAKFFFNSARSPPMSISRGTPFLSEIKIVYIFHCHPVRLFTCVISQFFQRIRQFELGLNLSSQLLHFSPTFSIFSPEQLRYLIYFTEHQNYLYLTSSMMVVVKAMPTRM